MKRGKSQLSQFRENWICDFSDLGSSILVRDVPPMNVSCSCSRKFLPLIRTPRKARELEVGIVTHDPIYLRIIVFCSSDAMTRHLPNGIIICSIINADPDLVFRTKDSDRGNAVAAVCDSKIRKGRRALTDPFFSTYCYGELPSRRRGTGN